MKGFVKWIIGVVTALLVATLVGGFVWYVEVEQNNVEVGMKIEANSEDIQDNSEDIKATNKTINSVSNQVTEIKIQIKDLATKDDLKRIEELLLWSHSDLKKHNLIVDEP